MFANHTIIITGGSSGVGKALAKRFVAGGADVAIVARDQAKLEQAENEIQGVNAQNRRIQGIACDVSDAGAVEDVMAEIVEAFGCPHVLINSAGVLREGYFESQDMETFRQIMDINFYGTLHCIRAVLPHLTNNGGGRIVNIASVAGMMGVFGYAAYCASKHAVVGLTAALRAELAPQNIGMHVVCPPEFESPMVDAVNENRTPENATLAHTIPVMGVDAVADAIMKGLEKDRYEIIPGAMTRAVTRLDKWLPALSRAVVDLQVKRCYCGPGK
ncbi:MAG: SDR family oxidoreductase [Thermodesulfobacteriota bacterium]